MTYQSINFQQKFRLFDEQWQPKVVAEMNDYQFKLEKVQGDFIWHDHKDTDETFIVIDGTVAIIVGLVAAPFILAGRRKLQRCNRIGGQVPELGVLGQSIRWNECWNESRHNSRLEDSHLGHVALLPEY